MTSWLCRGLVGRKRLPNFKKHDDLMCLSLDLSFRCFDVHGPMVYCLLILFQAGQDAEAASGEENSQGTFEKRHGPRPSCHLCRIFVESLPNLCPSKGIQHPWISHGSPMDLPWISHGSPNIFSWRSVESWIDPHVKARGAIVPGARRLHKSHSRAKL